MQLINGTGGLCETCNNAETCFYRATRGPALFCELFDNYVAPVDRSEVKRAALSAGPAAAPAAAEAEAAKYAGLCVNCEHRHTCKQATLEGGIWHCENYE